MANSLPDNTWVISQNNVMIGVAHVEAISNKRYWYQYEEFHPLIECVEKSKIPLRAVFLTRKKSVDEKDLCTMSLLMKTLYEMYDMKKRYFTFFECVCCKKLMLGVYKPWDDEDGSSLFCEKLCVELELECKKCKIV